MEYIQIQKKVIGIFESILENKGRKPWEIKVHSDEELQYQDFDSLETICAFLQIEDLFEREYGLCIDMDGLSVPNNTMEATENNYGLTPKNIVDYVAAQFPTTKRAN